MHEADHGLFGDLLLVLGGDPFTGYPGESMSEVARMKRQLEEQGYRIGGLGALRGEGKAYRNQKRFRLYVIGNPWHCWVGMTQAVYPIGYEAFGMTKRGTVQVRTLPTTFETVLEASLALADEFEPTLTNV